MMWKMLNEADSFTEHSWCVLNYRKKFVILFLLWLNSRLPFQWVNLFLGLRHFPYTPADSDVNAGCMFSWRSHRMKNQTPERVKAAHWDLMSYKMYWRFYPPAVLSPWLFQCVCVVHYEHSLLLKLTGVEGPVTFQPWYKLGTTNTFTVKIHTLTL